MVWNNPNWGRLGLKSPRFHFFGISGSSKFIAYTNIQIYVTGSIFIVINFFLNARNNVLITINNYCKVQKMPIYGSTIPLRIELEVEIGCSVVGALVGEMRCVRVDVFAEWSGCSMVLRLVLVLRCAKVVVYVMGC